MGGPPGNRVDTRSHSGHSHAHHRHDNTYLTSSNNSDPGVRITRVGLYVNLGMAVGKGVGGVVFNSQALTADALHALTDLVSDITTLATIHYSLRPPTLRFPTGYGKIESLGALAVSGLLLSGGIMIALQSLMALAQQFSPELAHMLSHIGLFEHAHGHGHGHGGTDLGPNINAAWLAGGSIVVKEWLYRATMKVAKKKRSSVLASNAYHHRVDSLTSLVALVTICASRFMSNAAWLDPAGGMVISAMIIQAGWQNTKTALFELADASVDKEVLSKLEKAANVVLQEQDLTDVDLKGVQAVKSGQNILVEIELRVPSDWPVARTEELEQIVRERVAAQVRGVRRVTVRFGTTGAEEPAFSRDFVARRASESEREDSGYDHHDYRGHEHSHANGIASGSTASIEGTTRKRNK